MAWRIEYAESVQKSVRRLDRQVQRRLRAFLEVRLAGMDNPRQLGIAMQGTRYGDLWRYRVGNYRIMAEIDDERTRILVVRIARSQRCIPLATAQEAKGEAARKLEEAVPLEGAKKWGPFRRRMSQFQALDPKHLRPRHHGSNFPCVHRSAVAPALFGTPLIYPGKGPWRRERRKRPPRMACSTFFQRG